jgi:CheY-like chemotaxis protein
MNNKSQIVLVDRDLIFIKPLVDLLPENNYVLFCDAKKALEHINGTNPDIISTVITDYIINDMTGIEFFRKIRSRKIQRILFVSSGYRDIGIKYLNEGVIDYFFRKIEKDLIIVLSYLVEKPKDISLR